MSDIVERLRGSPHTSCRRPGCISGAQVCPHDEDEIIEGLEDVCASGAREIERLSEEMHRLRERNDTARRVLKSCDKTIKTQHAEIERLRAALTEIIECPHAIPRADGMVDMDWNPARMVQIAKEALRDE
jgi:hypothetical protein